jgi:uncharacterized protein YecE (DUF72 family)
MTTSEGPPPPPGASPLPEGLRLGTSSWSSRDWEGVFYPAGTPQTRYLGVYAQRFRTVEVDATFYGPPAASTVDRWRASVPDGFLLAAKVPQSITHEKMLEGCEEEMRTFVEVMQRMGDRLGPLLLQFPFMPRDSAMTLDRFVGRLRPFLATLPAELRLAVEVRNRTWLAAPLIETLRERQVALALIDHPWMPGPAQLMRMKIDLVTAPFAYVRWLGDRHGIERITRQWNRTIVDRGRETRAWMPLIRSLLSRKVAVFGYFNNHYAGHAPASIELFEKTWAETSPE